MITIDVYGKSHIIEHIVKSTSSKILFKRILSYTTLYKINTECKYVGIYKNRSSHPFSFVLDGNHTDGTLDDLSKIMHKILLRNIHIQTDGYKVERYYTKRLYVRLYPTIGGQYLYLNNYHLALIEDISRYINYGLVSSNILTDMRLDNLDIPGLKYIDGIFVYERDVMNMLNDEERIMILDAVKSNNIVLRERGYTRVEGYNSILTEEITESFNIDVIEFSANDIYIKSPFMIGCELYRWLNNTIVRIRTNNTIVVNIYGDWQHEDLTLENRFKILYMSHIAYSRINKVVDNREDIKVLYDMSMIIPIYSNIEYIEFLKEINKLNEYYENITYIESIGVQSSIEIKDKILSDNIYSLPLVLIIDGVYAVVTKNMNYYIEPIEDDIYGFDTLYGSSEIIMKYPNAQIRQNVNIIEAVVRERRFTLYVMVDNSTIDDTIISRIQQMWDEGIYITKWGKYYYSAYGNISTMLVTDPIYVRGNQLPISI